MPNSSTWDQIHTERTSLCEILEDLTVEQWVAPSLCDGWNVHVTAGHVLAGAEMTPGLFFKHLAASGMRFNTMTDRDARRIGEVDPAVLIQRLRDRTATTNHPPGPPSAMLGEVVVHSQDICQPLGIEHQPHPGALRACLDLYHKANFPVGTKRRIAGLRLVATDVEWSTGSGPEVNGPAISILLAMTGRLVSTTDLNGEGVETLAGRLQRQ